MAKPQKEDGYTPTSNELLEAILLYPFTASEYRIVFYVIRQTYGWNKKSAKISYNDVSKCTGIHRRHVYRLMGGLVNDKILFKQQTEHPYNANIYGINKNYDEWVWNRPIPPESPPIPSNVLGDTQGVPQDVTKLGTSQGTVYKDIKDISYKKPRVKQILRDPKVRSLQKYYLNKLNEKFENPVFSFAIAGAKFKALLRTQSEDEIKSRIDRWFDNADKFYAGRGYKPEDFYSNYNALKPKEGTPQEIEGLIFKAKEELEKSAPTSLIIKWLKQIPKNYHFRIRKVLRERYKDGEQAYYRAEDELHR